MVKVLHTEWAGGWGGQEVRTITEMLGVREHGIEVFLACTSHATIGKKALEHGIPTFYLPFNGTADIRTLTGLMKIIREHDIDIVNTHSGKDTWVGGFAAKLTGRAFIRTRHLGYRVSSSRLNFINELADHVITTGEPIRESMIQYNRVKPERITSIPSGPDETKFNPAQYERASYREKWGLAPNDFVVGFVAMMRVMKRHDLFVEIAHNILKRHPNVKFVLSGDGPRRGDIEAHIKKLGLEDKFILTGFLQNPAEILCTFDIFLHPTENEGVPQSVMQALMMQLPVVATNAGGTGDLQHGDNFILRPEHDVPGLTEAVCQLIENPELRAAYANRARDHVVSHFSYNVMIDRVLKVYEQVLARKGKRLWQPSV